MPTGISWTDETWNPVAGCSRVSPGCDSCYAERQARRQQGFGTIGYEGVTEATPDGPRWTGVVNVAVGAPRYDQPLRWTKPRRIFVNSMSDLFHPEVLKATGPSGLPALAEIVAMMVACPQHTFQVLTKRPQLMGAVLADPRLKLDVNAHLMTLGRPVMPGGMSERDTIWPSHIWWGTSIESDTYAFRANHLRSTPAAVRFISAEPLLGPLPSLNLDGIDWVIVGGESGPRARRMDPAWASDLRRRCADTGTAFFAKQMGRVLAAEWGMIDSHGAALDEFPTDLQVQEFPDGH